MSKEGFPVPGVRYEVSLSEPEFVGLFGVTVDDEWEPVEPVGRVEAPDVFPPLVRTGTIGPRPRKPWERPLKARERRAWRREWLNIVAAFERAADEEEEAAEAYCYGSRCS